MSILKHKDYSIVRSKYSEQNNKLCQFFFGKLNQIYDAITDIRDDQKYQIEISERISNNILQLLYSISNQQTMQNQLISLKDENNNLKSILQLDNDCNVLEKISIRQKSTIEKQNNIISLFNEHYQNMDYHSATMKQQIETFINSILMTGLDPSKQQIMKMLTSELKHIEEIEQTLVTHQQLIEKTKFKLNTQDISRQLQEIGKYFDRIPQEWQSIQIFLREKIDSIRLPTDKINLMVEEQSAILTSHYKDLMNQIISPRPQVSPKILEKHSIKMFEEVTTSIISALEIPDNQAIITKHLKKLESKIKLSDSYLNLQDFFERMMKLKVPEQIPDLQNKLIQLENMNRQFRAVIATTELQIPNIDISDIQQKLLELQNQSKICQGISQMIPQSIEQSKTIMNQLINDGQLWNQQIQLLQSKILIGDQTQKIKETMEESYNNLKKKEETIIQTTMESYQKFHKLFTNHPMVNFVHCMYCQEIEQYNPFDPSQYPKNFSPANYQINHIQQEELHDLQLHFHIEKKCQNKNKCYLLPHLMLAQIRKSILIIIIFVTNKKKNFYKVLYQNLLQNTLRYFVM
ncbi:hypothetical protein ABPG72_019836 [Tetrahymena utriculariae]